jgi:hypothetical protein
MSLTELLAQLQKDYLATFPDKIKNLGTLWKTERITDLETEYHKLKGTGRTHGLPEVSQLGEAMERLCETDRKAPYPVLTIAVPISLEIFDKIRQSRERGEAFRLETEPGFAKLVAMVQASNSAAE